MTARSSANLIRILGTGATVAIVYFVVVLAALHYLRPDYVPARHMISDYAVGPFGWLMTSAFVALSICCVMLMLGLAGAGPRTIPARLGVALFGVAFCGLIVTAIYPTDIPGSRETSSGEIHNTTFLINVGSLLAATLLLTTSFARDPAWRPVRRPATILACLVIGAFTLQFLSLRPGAPYGIANRIFVMTLVSWLVLVAIRLRALGHHAVKSYEPSPNNALQRTAPEGRR